MQKGGFERVKPHRELRDKFSPGILYGIHFIRKVNTKDKVNQRILLITPVGVLQSTKNGIIKRTMTWGQIRKVGSDPATGRVLLESSTRDVRDMLFCWKEDYRNSCSSQEMVDMMSKCVAALSDEGLKTDTSAMRSDGTAPRISEKLAGGKNSTDKAKLLQTWENAERADAKKRQQKLQGKKKQPPAVAVHPPTPLAQPIIIPIEEPVEDEEEVDDDVDLPFAVLGYSLSTVSPSLRHLFLPSEPASPVFSASPAFSASPMGSFVCSRCDSPVMRPDRLTFALPSPSERWREAAEMVSYEDVYSSTMSSSGASSAPTSSFRASSPRAYVTASSPSPNSFSSAAPLPPTFEASGVDHLDKVLHMARLGYDVRPLMQSA